MSTGTKPEPTSDAYVAALIFMKMINACMVGLATAMLMVGYASDWMI